MTMLIVFVATILGQVANNVAGEVAANSSTIDLIVQEMPRDLGIMVVNFITGLDGLLPAVAGMLT